VEYISVPGLGVTDQEVLTTVEKLARRINNLFDEQNDIIPATNTSDTDLERAVEKIRILQVGHPEITAGVRKATSKVLDVIGEDPVYQALGFSVNKHGLINVDNNVLRSQLASNREETFKIVGNMAAMLSDRINYLINPFAVAYLNDINVQILKGAQKNEGSTMDGKELQREQDALEKKLNELRLLIEDSQIITDWFRKENELTAAEITVMSEAGSKE
jgi:hypothetical protein